MSIDPLFLQQDTCTGAHAWRDGRCVKCGEQERSARFEARRTMQLQPNSIIDVSCQYEGDSYLCSVDSGRKAVIWENGKAVCQGMFNEGELWIQYPEDFPAYLSAPSISDAVREALSMKIRIVIERRVFGF